MLRKFVLVISITAQWLLHCGAAHAELLVRGFDTQSHDRFSNSDQFIGDAYDWSGIGRTESSRWVTMISPHYFLSASHFPPASGETVTFYATNDVNGPVQQVTVQSGTAIQGSDIWLGRLTSAVNFGTFAVADIGPPSSYINQELYLFGLASGFPTTAQMRLGRNQIDAFIDNFQDDVLGPTVTDVIVYDYDDPTGGVGNDEARANGGDSGAPSFLILQGQPALVGLHWFQLGPGDFGPNSGTGDSFVPNYIDAINAAMLGEQLTVITVPEPSSLSLLGLSLLTLPLVRRKSANRSDADASRACVADEHTQA